MMDRALAELRSRLPGSLRLDIAPVSDQVHQLSPEEQTLVEHAVPSRRHEFSSARFLAHRLLSDLGYPQRPLLHHQDRSPTWPDGVLGSLSHSRRWCATVVIRDDQGLLGVGVDIEDLRPLQPDLFAEILTPSELRHLHAEKPSAEHATHVLACFSVKEAVYKAMHPLDNVGLGFHAMELDFTADPSRPRILPLPDLQRRLPHGSLPEAFLLRQHEILLSVALLAQPSVTSA